MYSLALNPVAFSLGAIVVHWYGIILGTGALAGLLLAIREGKRFGISPDFFMDLLLIGVPSAVIVARIYYVFFQWKDYENNLAEAFKIWHGGIAIHGALIGAVIAAIIYTRSKGYSFWRIADICAPSLLIGQIIGRWGNFMNQEAHGGPVAESFLRQTLHLPNFIVDQMNINGTYYHPTFLYESVLNIVGILVLFWLRRRPFLRAGELFMSYLIWYSIVRFYTEGFRTDSLAFFGPKGLERFMLALWSPMRAISPPGYMDPKFGNIRMAQLIGLLIIVAVVILIVVRRRTGMASAHYSDPIVSTKARAESAAPGEEAVGAESAEPHADEEDLPEDGNALSDKR